MGNTGSHPGLWRTNISAQSCNCVRTGGGSELGTTARWRGTLAQMQSDSSCRLWRKRAFPFALLRSYGLGTLFLSRYVGSRTDSATGGRCRLRYKLQDTSAWPLRSWAHLYIVRGWRSVRRQTAESSWTNCWSHWSIQWHCRLPAESRCRRSRWLGGGRGRPWCCCLSGEGSGQADTWRTRRGWSWVGNSTAQTSCISQTRP